MTPTTVLTRLGPTLLLGAALVLPAAEATAQGFPNVARTPGELLAGPVAPEQGRTAIIAWHDGHIVTVPEAPGSQPGADVLMRVVSIADPRHPVVTILPAHATGFHAHGYFQSGPYLYTGPWCLNRNTLQPCAPNSANPGDIWGNALRIGGTGTRVASSTMTLASVEETGLQIASYGRLGSQAPWGVNDFWSYNTISGDAYLAVRRNNEWVHDWNNGGAPVGPAVKATWDHLGLTGVTGFPFIIGNILLWASDQAGTGVASYDISDLANPVLLDVLKDGMIGGYWPEVHGHHIFFPRRDGEGGPGSQAGFMVVDYSDPANLRVVADRNLEGSNQYVTFQDEFAFMNRYKIDMRTFDVVLTLATVPGVLDASQFALPVGNLVVTGGYGTDGPGLAIWAHQAEPDTRAPYVAYHIPRPDQTGYSIHCPITLSIPETLRTETIVDGVSLIVRPLGGAAVPTWHSFGQGRLLTVTPLQPLAPDTTYEVVLTAAIQDAAGNGLEPYSFRFSTGSALAGGNQPPTLTALGAEPTIGAPGEAVTISWAGTDPDGDAVEYRLDPGDGSPRTAWGAATSAVHVYTQAGHYQMTVQARDPHGALSARTRTITVTPPPAAPGSTASSQLALRPANGQLFVVNPDANTVTAFHAATMEPQWESPVPAHPLAVAVANDGTVWVACRDGDAIEILDAASGAPVARIALPHGAAPVAIAPTPDAAAMLTTTEGDRRLRRHAVATRAETGNITLGPWPRAIAVTHDGTRALVTRFISGEHTGEVYDVSLAGAMSLTRRITLVRHRVMDGAATSRGVPNYLAGIRIAPDGRQAWVVGKKDNTTRGTFFSPLMVPGQDTTVRAQLHIIDLQSNAENVSLRLDLDNSDSPTAVAFSPLGDYAFITLQGNAQVARIDVLDRMRQGSPGTIQRRLAAGIAPQGVLLDPATSRLYTADFMSRTVTVHDLAAFLATGADNSPHFAVPTVARERLHPEVLRGKQIFYHASDRRMSAEGYISCATCHVGGGHDGRTWDFTNRNEGFRNTTDLRGRSGMGHGLVHWSGNFDEIQDFEIDIREFFGGTGFIDDAVYTSIAPPPGAPKAGHSADLDALAAYVASLGADSLPRSPHRAPDGTLTAAAERGRNLFNTHNCASCHIPQADYTDRLTHDVGTLRASSGRRLGQPLTGIDTPSLLGLHAGAPYFHDGSAATLEEVFSLTGGRLIQAEDAVLGGGAAPEVVTWMPQKEWHNGAFVLIDATATITLPNITTAAGPGYVELRYNAAYAQVTLEVTVNGGAPVTQVLPQSPNEPSWQANEWRRARVPVTFAAGANSITLRRPNGGQLLVDDVLVSTPDDAARAAAHVRGFTPAEVADLVAFLRSLDGQDAVRPAAALARVAPIAPGGHDTVPLDAGTLVYTITNSGAGPLNLGWAHVASAGGAVELLHQPPAQLAPGASGQLTLRLNAPGTAEVTLWTDDPSVGTLRWTLEATAQPTSLGELFLIY